VRLVRDFENIEEAALGIVTDFRHTYSVTIQTRDSPEHGETHEIPPEYLEAVEG